MGNIFLGKSYARCGGETIPRPFSKRSKLSIGSIVLIFIQFDLIDWQTEDYQRILSCKPPVLASYQAF